MPAFVIRFVCAVVICCAFHPASIFAASVGGDEKGGGLQGVNESALPQMQLPDQQTMPIPNIRYNEVPMPSGAVPGARDSVPSPLPGGLQDPSRGADRQAVARINMALFIALAFSFLANVYFIVLLNKRKKR